MTKPVTYTSDMIKEMVERRHPEYTDNYDHWNFLYATYQGGREWFDTHIFQYVKEGEAEYKDRVERAYRFNHSREIVDLVDKYIFKTKVDRNMDDSPDEVKAFWKGVTKNGIDVTQFMRQISRKSSIFGTVYVVVDNSITIPGLSVEDVKNAQGQVYAYMVDPRFVLDFSYDSMGQYKWVLIHEQWRDDSDAFNSSGDIVNRYRLWTQNSWHLFTEDATDKDNITYSLVDEGEHNLGEVPIVRMDNAVTDELYVGQSLINDIAYLDRAVANYLSNLDAIIQDQTFSQLVMPAQGILPGEDGYDKLIEMGTKRIFTYDGEGGAKPEFISPDVKQAEIIISVVNKIINEIYSSVGVAGERTKEDNAVGIDNSSGVAKAYDFERVNALLASKCTSLEKSEEKITKLVMKWHGDQDFDADLVNYPKNFDVRNLYQEFDIASRLGLIGAPDSVRREQMKTVIDKLFPKLAEDLKEKMLDELKDWPPEFDVELEGSGSPPTDKGATDPDDEKEKP